MSRQRWSTRARASLMLSGITLVLGAGAATAAQEKKSATGSMLDMFGVVTTDGTPLSKWEVPLTTQYEVFGKDLPDPFLTFVDIGWYLYRIVTGFTLWILGQAQSGSWRAGVIGIIDDTISPVFEQIHDLHVPTLIATFAFVVVAWTWVRGRAGASLGEAAVVILVHGLAVGVLASPVGKITEPGGGIDSAFRAASGITTELGEGQGGGTSRSEQRMADIMIGQPAQLMAFGELLTKECSGELTKALQDDATDRKAVRDKVVDCDERYKTQPTMAAVFGVGLFTGPFLTSINISTLMLSGLMIFLVLALIWYSIGLAWNAIFAAFPGRARTNLVDSAVKVLTCMAALVVCLVIAALVSQMLVQIFDRVRGEDGGLINTFRAYTVASGIASLLWILLWWKVLGALMRSKGKGKGLKDAANPSRKPTEMPSSMTTRTVRAAGPIAAHAIGARFGNPDPNPGPQPPNPAPAPDPNPGPPSPKPAPYPAPKPGSGGAKRLEGIMGNAGGRKQAAIRLATTAAVATATGGTSLAGEAVARTATSIAAQEAQRRLRGQLAAARTPTTPPTKDSRETSPAATAPHELPLSPGTSEPANQRTLTSSGAGERAAAMAPVAREAHRPAPHEIPLTGASRDVDEVAAHARTLPQRNPLSTLTPAVAAGEHPAEQLLPTTSRMDRGAPAPNLPAPAPDLPAPAAQDVSEPAANQAAATAKKLRERLYGPEGTAGDALSSYPDALSAEPVGIDL